MKTKPEIYFLAFGLIGFTLFYGSETYLLSMLSDNSNGQNPLLKLYPSLQEKIQTIGIEGLGSICGQLKFRWLYLVGFFFFLFRFQDNSDFKPLSPSLMLWKIRLFYVVQLVFLPDLLQELRFRGQWKALFQPLAQFSIVESSFPLEYYIQLTGIFLFGATAILVLVKWKEKDPIPLLLTIFIFSAWTFLLSLFFGFGKIDHTYASLYAGIIGMIVCRIAIIQNQENAGQGYRIFQAFIWSCYFFSGLEKISMSGLAWFDGKHFDQICQNHSKELCNSISSNPILGSTILLLGIGFQILSPLQWRFQKWGYINVFGGIVFHLGTWILFNVGGWQSPWLYMLLFLWPANQKKLAPALTN